MVESTRLESERTGNRTVGSNPTLSAMLSGPGRAGISAAGSDARKARPHTQPELARKSLFKLT